MSSDDVLHRAQALLVAERKLRRRHLALPALFLVLCLLLLTAVGVLYLRATHDRDVEFGQKQAALAQIAALNENRLALLDQLKNPHLTKSQIAVIAAELKTVTAQTRTIALQGRPGNPGPAGPPGLPGGPGPAGKNGVTGSPGPAGSGQDGVTGADGAPGQNGADGAAGKDGKDGSPPSSFTFTDRTGQTYTCTDPDQNGTYTCEPTPP